MSDDLEGRLRTGLVGAPSGPGPEAVLAATRLGARRRRRRRQAGGLVALVAAVVVVAGVLTVVHDPSTSAPAPTAPPSADGERPSTSAVAASDGSFFKLTSDVGCAACSTVWRRPPGGAWVPLHRFGVEAYGGRRTGSDGPLTGIAVSPDGQDVWATGPSLWSSHDGGATWAQVTDGPGAPHAGAQVAVTASRAFAVDLRSGREWVSPVGSDDWARFDAPESRFRSGPFFRLGDRVAYTAAGEGGADARVVATRDGATYDSLTLPRTCTSDSTHPEVYRDVLVVACPSRPGDTIDTIWRSVDLGPWEQAATSPAGLDRVYPLSATRLLAASYRGHDGVVLDTDLTHRTLVPTFYTLAVVGDEVILDGGDGDDRYSTDGGVTWQTSPEPAHGSTG